MPMPMATAITPSFAKGNAWYYSLKDNHSQGSYLPPSLTPSSFTFPEIGFSFR